MAIREFLYMTPDDMQTLYAPVTTSDVFNPGTGPGQYNPDWLTDGLPGRPVRFTDGDPTFSTTNPEKEVNCVALLNSTVDEGNAIDVSGDVTAQMIQPAYQGDFYPVNPFTIITPSVAYVADLTVSITGNTSVVIIGQFVAGLARVLDLFEQGGPVVPIGFNKQPDPQMGNIAVYDQRKIARRLTGNARLESEDALLDWYYRERDGVRFSLIMPHSDKNDAWPVKFEKKPERVIHGGLVTIACAWLEIPRKAWIRPELPT